MKLKAIDIRNYRVIRTAHLDLADRLIGIIGPNGAGKSSIVEAIAWGLYGQQAARSGKDDIRSTFAGQSDDCLVAVEFEVRGETYRIVRRMIGTRQRPEVELYRAGQFETVGTADTLAYIQTLLGLDWRGFLTSFLARQSELNALSDLQPAKRREHLVGMLGMERLDRAIDRAKSDVRLRAERIVVMEHALISRPDIASRIAELREHVAKLMLLLVDHRGARDLSAERKAAIEAFLAEHERLRDQCSEIDRLIAAEDAQRVHLSGRIEALAVERAHLSKLKQELALLQPELGKLEELKTDLRTAETDRNNAATRDRIHADLAASEQQAGSIRRELSQLAGKIDQTANSARSIPDDIADQVAATRLALETARERFSQLKERKEGAGRETAKLRANLESISELGPDAVCDRCLRPFGDDLIATKKHLLDELVRSEQAVAAVDQAMTDAMQEGKDLRNRLDDLELNADRRQRALQALSLQESEHRQLLSKLALLDSQISSWRGQVADLGTGQFDEQHYRTLNTKLTDLEKAGRRVHEMLGQLTRLAELDQESASASVSLAERVTTLQRLRDQRAQTGFDEAAFLRLKQDLAAAQLEAQDSHNRFVQTTHELELAERELKSRQEQANELDRAAGDLETAQAEQFRGEKLIRLFGELRRDLIAGIRPRLEELASKLLAEMTDGRYSLMELDEDYNITINDYGSYYPVERYSGGETDLANLCLRLAISQALTESAGLQRSCVILDEVFGSQDENRRDLIFRGLANLRSYFPQIIIITHIEELKHKVETLIEVAPTGDGWSEVRVDGILA